MIAKQLTSNTWLLTLDIGQHFSIVLKRNDQFLSFHDLTKLYDSLEQIAKERHERLIVKEIKKEIAFVNDINGYPVKHTAALFNIKQGKIPSYKIRESSNVEYAAGWWVIPFDGGIRTSLSPKLSTLTETSIGPFKTKFDADSALSNKKSSDNITNTYEQAAISGKNE